MALQNLTTEQIQFVNAIKSVSIQIADWAKGQLEIGNSIEQVKARLNAAAAKAGKF